MAIVLFTVVFAALIGTFHGGAVTVGGVAASSTVKYSNDNNETGTWTTTLSPSSSWYARLEIPTTSYSGPVTITWQLENETAVDTWTTVSGATVITTITLSGSAQNVYATANGIYSSNNQDWSTFVTTLGTYRVTVTVVSH